MPLSLYIKPSVLAYLHVLTWGLERSVLCGQQTSVVLSKNDVTLYLSRTLPAFFPLRF